MTYIFTLYYGKFKTGNFIYRIKSFIIFLINTDETDSIRFLIKATKVLKKTPLIHLHIINGEKVMVTEKPNHGLIDFKFIFVKKLTLSNTIHFVIFSYNQEKLSSYK